jgi:hypothetical protein
MTDMTDRELLSLTIKGRREEIEANSRYIIYAAGIAGHPNRARLSLAFRRRLLVKAGYLVDRNAELLEANERDLSILNELTRESGG